MVHPVVSGLAVGRDNPSSTTHLSGIRNKVKEGVTIVRTVYIYIEHLHYPLLINLRSHIDKSSFAARACLTMTGSVGYGTRLVV